VLGGGFGIVNGERGVVDGNASSGRDCRIGYGGASKKGNFNINIRKPEGKAPNARSIKRGPNRTNIGNQIVLEKNGD